MVAVLLSHLQIVRIVVSFFSFAGHYSLTYLYTGLSRPSKGTHRLQGTVFLNDCAFFHYNSEDGKDWEKQNQLQKAREDIFMETLNNIMEYYNNSSGSHALQERFGCEIQNNRSTGVFWKNACDGKDYVEFNKEIPAWVPLVPEAQNTKQKWEAEPVYVQQAKANLKEECPETLQKCLKYSKNILDRQRTHCFLLPSTELGKTNMISAGLRLGERRTPKPTEMWENTGKCTEHSQLIAVRVDT
uniref:MHC class I-like antigen recognition-like domain-containing protein n=1 Tax=Theropithecus gelada TaxID=9565 RepID=A0A8D2F374_THEGE